MTEQKDQIQTHWKRHITLFLASQIITLFGSSIVQFAIMWHITLTTKSGIMMTIAILCGFLPTLFMSPLGGVWADRFNRKWLIILSDSTIALATLVLAVLFLAGYEEIWLLFFISAVRAVGAAVQTPAVGAFIPQIVPQDKLTRVNGINATIQSIISLLSPILSAGLMAMIPLGLIFFVDVGTAVIGVSVLILFLKIPAHAGVGKQRKGSYLGDFSLGLKYIRAHDFLKRFFIFMAIYLFLVAPAAFLTPLQVTRSFGGQYWRLTSIEIAFSAGMILGGLAMASWGGFRNRMHTMTLAGFIVGFGTVMLGLVPNFWIYLSFMAMVGVAMPMFNTPSTVLLQEKVDPDYLGRVFGVLTMITSSAMPLGMLIFGPLADWITIESILLITGGLLLILAFFLFKNKVLMAAGLPSESAD